MSVSITNHWRKQKNGRSFTLFEFQYHNFFYTNFFDMDILLLNFRLYLSFSKEKRDHSEYCRAKYEEYLEKIKQRKASMKSKPAREISSVDTGFSIHLSKPKFISKCRHCGKHISSAVLSLFDFSFYKHPHEPRYKSVRLRLINGVSMDYTWLDKKAFKEHNYML